MRFKNIFLASTASIRFSQLLRYDSKLYKLVILKNYTVELNLVQVVKNKRFCKLENIFILFYKIKTMFFLAKENKLHLPVCDRPTYLQKEYSLQLHCSYKEILKYIYYMYILYVIYVLLYNAFGKGRLLKDTN